MKQIFPWQLFYLMFLLPVYGSAAINITEISMQDKDGYSTFMLDLDGPVNINLFPLDNPDRVVLDLSGVRMSNLGKMRALKSSVLRGIRAASQSDGRLRIVLDMTRPIWPRSYFKAYGEKTRLIVELRDSVGVPNPIPSAKTSPTKAEKPAPMVSSDPQPALPPSVVKRSRNASLAPDPLAPTHPIPPEAAKVVNKVLTAQPILTTPPQFVASLGALPDGLGKSEKITHPAESVPIPSDAGTRNHTVPIFSPAQEKTVASLRPGIRGRDIVIAVDAGHGGKDPGATGPGGTEEKTVTLAIARRVAELIRQERGMRPILIRNGDYFVELRERVQKARAAKADLFISIHADAAHDPSAAGASVYVVSEKGASSEAARFLAEKENAVDLVGGVHLEGRDSNLARTLLNMSQSATLNASLAVAERILSNIEKIGYLSRDSVERAGFLVLKAPDIPSVLVETAYLSNPNEEEKLGDPNYQQTIAKTIVKGIRAYFLRSPPSDSLLAKATPG